MRRREFITLLGGAAAVWPLAARAQQPDRVRRIGVLMLYAENDPAGQLRATAFRQTLERLGWAVGNNLQIDYHWGIGDAAWIRDAAAQLLQLSPDMILANGGQTVRQVQQVTRTLPIIFIGATDPVAEGFVRSLSHPGGNLTGAPMTYELGGRQYVITAVDSVLYAWALPAHCCRRVFGGRRRSW